MKSIKEYSVHEYWKEIERLARAALEKHKVKSKEDYQRLKDELDDVLFEYVRDSEWRLFPRIQLKVLEYTRNRNSLIEKLGWDWLEGVVTFEETVSQFAESALLEDARLELEEVADKLPSVTEQTTA